MTGIEAKAVRVESTGSPRRSRLDRPKALNSLTIETADRQ